MVRSGSAKPDISTVDKLKQVLLRADSVAFSKVGTGIAFAKIVERLGIADQIKAVRGTPAEITAHLLQGTGSDIGVGTIALILADKRMALAGALLDDVQSYLLYVAAPTSHPWEAEAARTLVNHLNLPQTKTQFATTGAM